MATLEDVEAARQRMLAAEQAVWDYAGRPESQTQDVKLHLRLAENLRDAVDEYLTTIAQLRR